MSARYPALIAAHSSDPYVARRAFAGVFREEVTGAELALFANPDLDRATAEALLDAVTADNELWWPRRATQLSSARSGALREAILARDEVPGWVKIRCAWLDDTTVCELLDDAGTDELNRYIPALFERYDELLDDGPTEIREALCAAVGRWARDAHSGSTLSVGRRLAALTAAMRAGGHTWPGPPDPTLDERELAHWLGERRRGIAGAVGALDVLAHPSCGTELALEAASVAAACRAERSAIDALCAWIGTHPGCDVGVIEVLVTQLCTIAADIGTAGARLGPADRARLCEQYAIRNGHGTTSTTLWAVLAEHPDTAEHLQLAWLSDAFTSITDGTADNGTAGGVAAIAELISSRCRDRTAALAQLWENGFDGTLGEAFAVIDAITAPHAGHGRGPTPASAQGDTP